MPPTPNTPSLYPFTPKSSYTPGIQAMISKLKNDLARLLRKTEKYTKTDMVAFFVANFWINIGRVISIATGMLLTVGFANLLTPEQFGTYKYVIALAGTIGAFSLHGMSGALMRALAQGKKHVIPGVVNAAMLWSVPASILTLAVSAYYFYQGNEQLGFALVFVAAANTLGNGYGLSKSILLALGDFKRNTIVSVPRTLFPVVCVLAALTLTQNVTWVLFAYFTSNTLAAFIQYRWSLRDLKVVGSNKDVSETVTYSKHLSLVGFFVLISGQIDQLLLFHFTGAAPLALYALALAPIKEVRNLLDNILLIAFPKIAARTEAEVRQTMALRIKQLLILSLLAVMGYILLVPFLFKYLFPKYIAAIFITQILSITLLFQWRGLIDTFILTHGMVKKRYIAILSSQAIEFLLFCTLIPLFGLWGAIAATVLSEAVAALSIYLVYKMR